MFNKDPRLQKISQRIKFILSIPSANQHFKTYPPTFIVGAPRSGTTLTLKLFQNQPLITPLFEPWAFWKKAFSDSKDDTYKDRLNWLGFQALKYLYYREITPQKPYLVVKDPRDSFRIDTLNYLFPNAKFIHIIRDGRDVVASMMKTFGKDIYLAYGEEWTHVRIPNYKTLFNVPSHIIAAMQWQYCVESSLKQLAAISEDRKFTFYYEELVNYPEQITKNLFDFAYPQLSINDTSLTTIIKSISNEVIPNLTTPIILSTKSQLSWQEKMKQFSSQVKNDAGSGTTSDRIRVGRWQDELNDSILSDIASIIGDTLKKLDYQ